MRTLLSALALAALTACGGGGSDDGFVTAPTAAARAAPAPEPVAQQTQQIRPTCHVQVFSDSVLNGYYAEAGQVKRLSPTPMERLREKYPELIIDDRSVPGQNLQNLVDGFTHPDLPSSSANAPRPNPVYIPALAQQPQSGKVVVIENGVIDAWLAVINGEWTIAAAVDFYERLTRAVSTILKQGRRPIIAGFSRQAVNGFISQPMISMRDWFESRAKLVAAQQGVPFADLGAARFDGQSDLLDEVHPARAYSDRLVDQLAPSILAECAK